MSPILLIVAAAALHPRTIALGPDVASGRKALRIECPVGRSTRLVFSIADLGVKYSAGARERLGLRKVASRPETVIVLSPPKHPAKGTVELTASGVDILVGVESTERGGDAEIRFVLGSPAPETRAPAAEPSATKAPTPSRSEQPAVTSQQPPREMPEASPPPSPRPASEPAASSSTQPPQNVTAPDEKAAQPPRADPPSTAGVATVVSSTGQGSEAPATLDMAGLLSAEPVVIGRREGQPGRPEMVLQDALKAERWVWLRFVLEGGAGQKVEQVSWEQGTRRGEAVHVQEPKGKNLLVVAQLPRAEVTRKTRVTVRVAQGGTYRFAVSSSTLTNLLKGLF